MQVGYARVSTEDQKLEIQQQKLKQAGCKRIFQEKVSGAHRQRPELAKLLEQLRDGDNSELLRFLDIDFLDSKMLAPNKVIA